MKKLINYLKKLRMNYYDRMMDVCAMNSEVATIEFGEESRQNIYWVRRYDRYSRKYEKTLMKAV